MGAPTHAVAKPKAAVVPVRPVVGLREILRAAKVKPKLTIGSVNDPAEADADRIAERVLGSAAVPLSLDISAVPRDILRRKCAHCEEEEKKLRRKSMPSLGGGALSAGGPLSPAMEAAIGRIGSGMALPAAELAFFEPRFGRSLTGVRVHDGPSAATATQVIGARAFAVGHSIAFNQGEYRPGTTDGRRLLAHELAHVMQHDAGYEQIRREPAREEAATHGASLGNLEIAFKALKGASLVVPGLTPVMASFELIRGAVHLWEHRHEHMAQLLDAIGAAVATVPGVARTKLNEFLASAGTTAEAGSCIGEEMLRFLESLAQNWRGVISSFISDIFLVGLFKRSLPAIIDGIGGLLDDLMKGEFRSAVDRGVTIVTELNAIAGVIYLWSALISTLLGAAAGSEVPIAGNAAGAVAGLSAAQVINVALIASVVATETTRIARGIDDMVRFWDDLPARQSGCQQVAEGVFSLALTGALFYLGPGMQRVARSIISRAGVAARSTGAIVLKEATVVVERLATPNGLALAYAGPEPLPRVTARSSALGGTTTAHPPAQVRGPKAKPVVEPVPASLPATRIAPAPKTLPATLTEEPDRRFDACEVAYGLRPSRSEARWIRQRSPIDGQTTVSEAAFRLDPGIAPPEGQEASRSAGRWVRTIGLPFDDAGHVIANRFGGQTTHNAQGGNIFPQDLSFNRGTMRGYDRVAADLHRKGCPVCVHIRLHYASNIKLRPDAAIYTILYRSRERQAFNPPIGPVLVPNP